VRDGIDGAQITDSVAMTGGGTGCAISHPGAVMLGTPRRKRRHRIAPSAPQILVALRSPQSIQIPASPPVAHNRLGGMMLSGVARPVRAVVSRLSCIEQLGWVRSAVTVACATPSPLASERGDYVNSTDDCWWCADTHVAAAIDANGGVLGIESFPADRGGFEALLGWLMSHGEIDRVGVEGTGSWGGPEEVRAR